MNLIARYKLWRRCGASRRVALSLAVFPPRIICEERRGSLR